MHTRHSSHRLKAATDRGVVMIIALMLMLAIGISSTAAIRLAMTGSAIANGLKAHNEAQQAADLALRWCELQVRQTAAGGPAPAGENFNFIDIGRLPITSWQNHETYVNNARPIPQVILNDAGMVAPNQAPTCMIQEAEFLAGNPEDEKNTTGNNSSFKEHRMIVITARGMSSDFIENAEEDDRGSEVWQQVNLVISPR